MYEGEQLLEKCPMCGAPMDKHVEVAEEIATKVYNADYTNGLHTEVINLAATIVDLCEAGIEDDLDPMCVKVFTKAKDLAWEIKQLSKAEIGNHVRKDKW